MKLNTTHHKFLLEPRRFIALLLFIAFFQSACKKFIEVDPPATNLNAENVYLNDATAISVMTGVYTKIANNYLISLTGNSPVSSSLYLALAADELTLFNLNNANLNAYYSNDVTSNSGSFVWNAAYDIIYTVNNVIEGLEKSNNLTANVKQQLMGEAKFMRAFCLFYLVNVHGGVPLTLSTDWKINSSLPRSSSETVYLQIIKDLKDAQDLMSSSYYNSNLKITTEKTRPNKWVATALLSRVYLFTGDWMNAETESSSVIENKTLFDTVALKNVFLKNSKEAIWQFQPVRSGIQSNTGEGTLFILPTTGPNTTDYPVYLSSNIVNSFDSGDSRKIQWIDSVKPASVYYYPKKYKIEKVNTSTQEYEMVFRLAEQYLIRAEARAQQDNISGAKEDLNMIRYRAGLPKTTSFDKYSLLSAIMQERKVELFTEWGHRWMDLKRTNTIDGLMTIVTPQKGGTWISYKAFFPIPQSEITLNPQLTQNEGY